MRPSEKFEARAAGAKSPQEIKEVGDLSKEQKFNRIWKWGGIILTISIILGIARSFLAR